MNEKGGMNDEEFDKYIDNSIVPLYPDLGGQRLRSQREGPAEQGTVPRSIPFSWPSKRYLRAAGDGYELWSVQVCRPLEPQKHRHSLLLCQEVNEVGAVYFWIDRLRRGLSDIESQV
jgi:hypothetical protein